MKKRTLYGLGLLLALATVGATACAAGSSPMEHLQSGAAPTNDGTGPANSDIMVSPDLASSITPAEANSYVMAIFDGQFNLQNECASVSASSPDVSAQVTEITNFYNARTGLSLTSPTVEFKDRPFNVTSDITAQYFPNRHAIAIYSPSPTNLPHELAHPYVGTEGAAVTFSLEYLADKMLSSKAAGDMPNYCGAGNAFYAEATYAATPLLRYFGDAQAQEPVDSDLVARAVVPSLVIRQGIRDGSCVAKDIIWENDPQAYDSLDVSIPSICQVLSGVP